MKSRVAITGLGSYVPVAGAGFLALCDLVFSGGSLISFYDPGVEIEKKNSKVRGFCDEEKLDVAFDIAWGNKKDCRRMDKFLKLALVAGHEAVLDASLFDGEFYSRDKIGVITGTGVGGIKMLSDSSICFASHGQRKISPFTIPYGITNMASSLVAMKYGIRGPAYAVSSACTSGNHALICAAQQIELGICDAVVVLGTEATADSFAFSTFDVIHSLSTNFNDRPQMASRPMDKDRDGFVMSDGSAAIVIENYEKAKLRGAKIYAEIAGYGMSCVATHITAPDSEGLGAFNAMKNAIDHAGISKKDIGLINMHATSTQAGDKVEALAISNCFGDDNHPCLSATKNATGHMIGAVSLTEVILTINSMKRKICPPNINLDNPEDIVRSMNMKKESQEIKDCQYVLSNSFGFGGTNSSVIIKNHE